MRTTTYIKRGTLLINFDADDWRFCRCMATLFARFKILSLRHGGAADGAADGAPALVPQAFDLLIDSFVHWEDCNATASRKNCQKQTLPQIKIFFY